MEFEIGQASLASESNVEVSRGWCEPTGAHKWKDSIKCHTSLTAGKSYLKLKFSKSSEISFFQTLADGKADFFGIMTFYTQQRYFNSQGRLSARWKYFRRRGKNRQNVLLVQMFLFWSAARCWQPKRPCASLVYLLRTLLRSSLISIVTIKNAVIVHHAH